MYRRLGGLELGFSESEPHNRNNLRRPTTTRHRNFSHRTSTEIPDVDDIPCFSLLLLFLSLFMYRCTYIYIFLYHLTFYFGLENPPIYITIHDKFKRINLITVSCITKFKKIFNNPKFLSEKNNNFHSSKLLS